MQWLKNIFRKKYTIVFHMKGGQTIKKRVYKYEITKSYGEFTGYSLTSVNKYKKALYIRLSDVSFIELE